MILSTCHIAGIAVNTRIDLLLFFFILRRMGEDKAPTLPRIRYMCFDLTHAPVATAARAAATGLVSMSTRPVVVVFTL